MKNEFLINDRINTLNIGEDSKDILLYIHGLGADKEFILRFSDLLKSKYNIFSIDLPCHGKDKTNYKEFNLDICIKYVLDTISYLKNKYNSNIYLFGSSYGGFVILNGYERITKNVKKIYLMNPAINFCEIMERKVRVLDEDYYKENEYLPLYSNVKIYHKAYLEFKEADKYVKNHYYKNVYIVQGNIDRTVLVNDILDFVNKNKLIYKIIENGKHELYGFEEEIVNFILEN